MDFALNSDQITLNSELDKLASKHATSPTEFRGFVLEDKQLNLELEQGGFFEAAEIPELGPVSAAMMVERLARLPYTAEVALSMLVGPQLNGDWPRPFAVVENGRPGRFVADAATLIILDGDKVGVVSATPDAVEAVDSLFAYPMGRLNKSVVYTPLSEGEAANVRKWLRIALAAEAAGLLQAALDAATEHLTLRKQFGRPLGSFQAIQHRMAECTVLARGVRLLAIKAAWTGDAGDAAVAALHAQESATRVVYDLHQFMGAMGMTLEFPLHLWTYRLKALLPELNGRGGQAQAVAEHCFKESGNKKEHVNV
ncbi:acyl-CoA dehydrogenase [Ketobacter sp. MCCC 1A13808]|uniref:acyl-CoA dehydrogenase family protein n=1 Tax=Ketobacter sp. MCCC 1A13808 TaxID=2602738 RepID=UPI0012EBE82C|nr:acyl-CoA dehydrogenase family protein [Ketobacter sp. MCCC 1A13808]MVF13451.1 acyl-CoA dehydrogenase [Ketobacter sp. MCCC 1A13808]